MKTKRNVLIITTLLFLTFLSSCSSDDDDSQASDCLKDSFLLTETEVDDFPSGHTVFIDFNVTNNSSTDYSISGGSTPIYIIINVTTTDGTVFETKTILTLASLSAGATGTFEVFGDYGAGKTYESYTIELTCDN